MSIYKSCDDLIEKHLETIQLCIDSLNDMLGISISLDKILKLRIIYLIVDPKEVNGSRAFRLMGEHVKNSDEKKKIGKSGKELITYQTSQIVNLSKRRISFLSESTVKQVYKDCYLLEHCFMQIKMIEKLKARDEELQEHYEWIEKNFE